MEVYKWEKSIKYNKKGKKRKVRRNKKANEGQREGSKEINNDHGICCDLTSC